jgi:hypothetical protein
VNTKAAFTGRLLLSHAVADFNRLPNGDRTRDLEHVQRSGVCPRTRWLLEAP